MGDGQARDQARDRARVNVDAAGWARAVSGCGFVPPPGFEPSTGLAAGGGGLVAGEVPSVVVAALGVLAEPQVSVQVVVGAGAGRGMRAVLGLAGGAGAGVLTLPEGGVQVSVFPAVELAAELVRVVPGVGELVDPQERIVRGLDGGDGEPVAGVVPLAALTQLPIAGQALGVTHGHGGVGGPGGVADLPLSAEQAELVGRLVRGTRGVLQALVGGPVRVGGQVGAGVGQAIWCGPAAGWVAGEPAPGPDGARWVRLRPVEPADLPAALAPVIAQILTSQAAATATAPESAGGER
jgi:hypothetical protein